MTLKLIVGAVIIIACIISNKVSSKMGMPMLLAFIVLGMIFGSDGIFKIPFANFQFAEQICSLALVFLIFYGGFGTNISRAKKVATKAILLSSIGVIATALLTGLFCYYALGFELLESMLIGSVLSSTDAATVFSILRSQKLNLKDGTASLLEIESGSNDPWAYTLTIIILSLMNTSGETGSILYLIFAQIFFGVIFGVIIAAFAYWVLKTFTFEQAGFDAIFVLAVAILAYAIPTAFGGNGYLSAYIVGIVLGNKEIINKKALVNFFDGLTGLMQMLTFFLLGLLAFPSQIPKIILPAIAIAIFLTIVARPVAVFAILTPFKAKFAQQTLISWGGLRGATSIIFAIMATVGDNNTENDIFHIVFCVVLLSIGIQGSLLPWVSKKLKMIDDKENVLKTFNDYSDETEIQFIRLPINENHSWIGKKIKNITLPPTTLIVMIQREKQRIIPNGNTIIEENDILIISAIGYYDDNSISLREIEIDNGHEWCNQKLSKLSIPNDNIVVLIKRRNKTIIPNGDIKVKADDTLVVTSSK